MRVVEFKRLMPKSLPKWAEENWNCEISNPPEKFDISLAHEIGHVTKSGYSEWSTIENILESIRSYNSQFTPADGQLSGEDDPGYVALSMLKCVEAGLAEMRVVERVD